MEFEGVIEARELRGAAVSLPVDPVTAFVPPMLAVVLNVVEPVEPVNAPAVIVSAPESVIVPEPVALVNVLDDEEIDSVERLVVPPASVTEPPVSCVAPDTVIDPDPAASVPPLAVTAVGEMASVPRVVVPPLTVSVLENVSAVHADRLEVMLKVAAPPTDSRAVPGVLPSRSTRRMFQVCMGRVWPRRRQQITK